MSHSFATFARFPPTTIRPWWISHRPTDSPATAVSICYVTWDLKKLTYPQIPAVIEIDGASEGHGILHLIADVDPKEVRVGMKVQAVWKPVEEREGAITDLKHWAPVK